MHYLSRPQFCSLQNSVMNSQGLELYEDGVLSMAAGSQKPSISGHFPSYLFPNQGDCWSIYWNPSVTCIRAKSLQLCVIHCDPMAHSPPGFSVAGLLGREHWSQLLCPPPGDLPDSGTEPASPALAGFFTTESPGKPPPPNIITLVVRISIWELFRDTNVQNIIPDQR